MILLFGFIAFAAVTIVFLYWTYRAGSSLAVDSKNLEKQLRPIDLELVQNLLDPQQERYIRAKVTRYQFVRYKLKQFTTANEYISRAAHNAAVFVALGKHASHSSDASTAAAGQALFEAAIRLRIFTLLARANLALKLIFPRCSIGSFIESYASTRARVAHFSATALALEGGNTLM
jgi:hypothetical protein